MSNPQTAFVEMLLAAMKDAALNRELTQLAIQFDPTETGKGKLHRVRVIVVPEKLDWTWPSAQPLGTPIENN